MGTLGAKTAALALVGVLLSIQAGYAEDDNASPEQEAVIPEETLDQIATVLEECKDGTIKHDMANERIHNLLLPHLEGLNPSMDILAYSEAKASAEGEVRAECGPDPDDADKKEPYVSPLEL